MKTGREGTVRSDTVYITNMCFEVHPFYQGPWGSSVGGFAISSDGYFCNGIYIIKKNILIVIDEVNFNIIDDINFIFFYTFK